jgi:hypothetical protein
MKAQAMSARHDTSHAVTTTTTHATAQGTLPTWDFGGKSVASGRDAAARGTIRSSDAASMPQRDRQPSAAGSGRTLGSGAALGSQENSMAGSATGTVRAVSSIGTLPRSDVWAAAGGDESGSPPNTLNVCLDNPVSSALLSSYGSWIPNPSAAYKPLPQVPLEHSPAGPRLRSAPGAVARLVALLTVDGQVKLR